MEIQFPRNLKMMQSFLGEALFFIKSFVPDYSELTAALHDMTRKVDWSDKSTWKQDYEAVFVEFKKALCNALLLYYPEYDWAWILRMDATDIACVAILLQVRPSDGALLPINITSKRFSSTARQLLKKKALGAIMVLRVMITFCAARSSSLRLTTTTSCELRQAKYPRSYAGAYICSHLISLFDTFAAHSIRLQTTCRECTPIPLLTTSMQSMKGGKRRMGICS